nr:MAK10-like protein [Tanacetum cinerariifolium]
MGGSYYPIPCSILSIGKDRKTPQRYPDVPTTSWRISIQSIDSFQGLTPKSPSLWHRPLAQKDLSLYDNESWNDPRDFAKPVKAIVLPQDVPSTSDRRLIELENQVQRLIEAHLALTQPTQMNKITTLCEICSGPHDTQYCMENPKQAFVEYASSRTDEAGGKWYTFKPEQNNLGDSSRSTPSRSTPSYKAIPVTTEPKRMRKKRETAWKAIPTC